MVSHPCSSIIAAWIIARLSMFADEHDLGWVSGADGAFISKARCPKIPDAAYHPLAPDLALEVLSPNNTDGEMRVKVVNYLADGTIVWIVDPGKSVELYRPGQRVQILGADDTLECGIFS